MAGKREEKMDNSNQSSDKLFKIVECLAANRLPKRLSDISKQLEMPQATTLRYLNSLCQQGYAFQDEKSGCYGLTWKICRIGDAIRMNLVLRSMAGSFLNSLSNDLNASTCLAIENNNTIQYLDFVDSPHGSNDIMSSVIRIGKQAPMNSTASGKLFLSSYSDRKLKNFLDVVGLERVTSRTIVSFDTLVRELDTIREQGYAIDNEECEPGHVCVSVPLKDYTGNTVAALSAYDDVEHFTMQRIQAEVLPELLKAASIISYRLGHQAD